MKRPFAIFVMCFTVLALAQMACNLPTPKPLEGGVATLVSFLTATPGGEITETATPTRRPTRTPTMTPTFTPTFTPTPPLWVLADTPIPDTLQHIAPENAQWVSGLAEWQDFPVTDLDWTPDGQVLAVAGSASIKLYDVNARQALRVLHPRSEGIVDIAFNPSGGWLVAGSRRGSEEKGYVSSLELWRGPDWKPMGLLYGSGRALSSMEFSPDGKVYVTAFTSSVYEQNSVEIWSTLSWTITETVKTGTILDVAFSPSEGLLAVTPDRYAIRVWDLAARDWLHTLPTSFTGAVTRIAFSPDGTLLASGHYDGAIRLWDVKTGVLLRAMSTEEVIESLAFSPDGRLIATGGSYHNYLVRIWEAASGALLRTLEGHTSGVAHLSFSPDILFLVSATYDGALRLWGIRP